MRLRAGIQDGVLGRPWTGLRIAPLLGFAQIRAASTPPTAVKLRALLTLVVLLASRPALAADPLEDFPDPTAAERLRLEGRTLARGGQYAEACSKLVESVRLEPGIDAELELADCHEHLGKIATAWSGFTAAAAAASRSGDSAQARGASKRARALEPRVPKLFVDVPSAPPGLEVKLDGVLVEDARWGTAIPVDPGSHRVTATASGKARWVTKLDVSEGASMHVAVPTELAPAPSGTPPPEREAEATGAPPTGTSENAEASSADSTTKITSATAVSAAGSLRFASVPRTTERSWPNRSMIGWTLSGIGAAGLGLGLGFGLASMSARDESASHCAGDFCDRTGVALRADAIDRGNMATFTTLAGAAALAGGLVVLLTTKTRSAEEKPIEGLRASPSVAQGGGSVVVQGAFR